MKKKMLRHPISKKRVLLIIVDLIIVIGSMFLSSIIRIGLHDGLHYIEANYMAFCLIGVIYFFAFYVAGLYDFLQDFRLPYNLLTIACTSIIAFAIVMFCFYVNLSLRLGRGIFLINGILITSFLISWRYLYSHLTAHPQFLKKSLIVGAGWAGKTILEEIKKTQGSGLQVVGFIDDDKTKIGSEIDGLSVLGGRDDLLEIVKRHKISQIVLAITHEKHADLIKALIKCSQKGVNIIDMLALYESLTAKIPFKHINDLWLLNSMVGKSNFYVKRIKRCMDNFFSIIMLAILSPLIPVIAILIKTGSQGSVFYIQERLGKDGRPFNIIKFRSMIQNAEETTGVVCTTDHDSRITRVGRFLRKWRLDEVPQLVNVIKGDMSLVGPRPERSVFINSYQEKIPFYSQRLTVRPGITGWAQIKYPYASSFEQTEEKLKYDLYYIKNISFTLDCVILLQTIKVILFGKGK